MIKENVNQVPVQPFNHTHTHTHTHTWSPHKEKTCIEIGKNTENNN